LSERVSVSFCGAGAEWWRGCVIYQVYPRSFQDTTGDGVGDLNGVTRRMPYLASLGVDAIWLSPFFKSPMADMGYDVSDYCDVDPLFGTLADFDALVAEAHRHGLKIIIDQVISHTSDRHPWFVESRRSRLSPRSDWYVWAEPKPDGSAPNNWLSVFGGPAWEWDAGRRQYYMHNFLAAQPDLNFHNPEVQDALLDTLRFWLERGVDGFRLDTVNYYFHDQTLADNPPRPESLDGTIDETGTYLYQLHLHDKTQPENLDFLARMRALLDAYGHRAMVGEVGDESRSLETVAAYTSGSERLHMCYTFDLLGPQFSAAHVAKCIDAFETEVADGWICWAFSNHDVVRHVTRWSLPGDAPDAVAKFSIALIACLRGSICLYQGEELGLEEAELAFEDLRDPYGIRFWPAFKGRDGARTPMVWDANAANGGFSTARPWLPIPAAHLARSVDAEEADPQSVLTRYLKVLAFRRGEPALHDGGIERLDADADVLAFVREAEGHRLLCLFNFARERAVYELPEGETLAGEPGFPGSSSATADGVVLPPLGYAVLALG
jgi:alpha-glucosidase